MGYGNPPDPAGTTGSETSEGQGLGDVQENPIVAVDLEATESNRFYYRENPEEQYIGLYHRHEDGTLMIGGGELGISHDMNIDEIIFQKFDYETLQEVREIVSDNVYRLWFESRNLTNEEVLTLQTTIRDGIKTLGRTEDEPLVFFKKDRNTLESRKDLQGDTFEIVCQHVYDNNITDISSALSLITTSKGTELIPPELEELGEVVDYIIDYTYGDGQKHSITIATKIGNVFTDVLNLGQLTTPKTTTKINPIKAKEILDTDIFELLPTQSTRQQEINNFFVDFNDLIGAKPPFEDVDGDGIGESISDGGASDSGSRISEGDVPGAGITRLDSQANELNQGQTLESMRNRLNSYLSDVDNVVQSIEDQRPQYENVSEGFLKVRRPNQAIILRSPDNKQLAFSKPVQGAVVMSANGTEVVAVDEEPSYLVDGFTITMWAKFLSKTSEGTLFNYGNPLERSIPGGFRLDTRVNEHNGKVFRYFRLMVDDYILQKYIDQDDSIQNRTWDGVEIMNLRDNHTGANNDTLGIRSPMYDDTAGATLGRLNQRIVGNQHPEIHRAFPHYEIKDVDDWYFICATFNPRITERIYVNDENSHDHINSPYYNGNNINFSGWTSREYWLNHLNQGDMVYTQTGVGTLDDARSVRFSPRTPFINAIQSSDEVLIRWPVGVEEATIRTLDIAYITSGDGHRTLFFPEGTFDDIFDSEDPEQVEIGVYSPSGGFVSNSGVGAKCKVEFISRSDLLRARGYKLPDESLRMETIEEEVEDDGDVDSGDNNGGGTQQQTQETTEDTAPPDGGGEGGGFNY